LRGKLPLSIANAIASRGGHGAALDRPRQAGHLSLREVEHEASISSRRRSFPRPTWSKLEKVAPGASSLIFQSKALGGIEKFESLAGLAPAFGKMGLSTDQVKCTQGGVSDFIGKATGGGADLAKKFNDAIK
jgi:hypothetical protein